MIKANELRIGNYLLNDEVLVKIDARSIFDIWDDKGLKDYKPIPLTEECLLRSKFRRLDRYTFTYKGFFIHRRKRGFVYGKNLIVGSYHQLQNLFFSLKQDELTLESNEVR